MLSDDSDLETRVSAGCASTSTGAASAIPGRGNVEVATYVRVASRTLRQGTAPTDCTLTTQPPVVHKRANDQVVIIDAPTMTAVKTTGALLVLVVAVVIHRLRARQFSTEARLDQKSVGKNGLAIQFESDVPTHGRTVAGDENAAIELRLGGDVELCDGQLGSEGKRMHVAQVTTRGGGSDEGV